MNKWLFKGSTPKQRTTARATTTRDSREAGLKVAGLIQTRKGEPFSWASKGCSAGNLKFFGVLKSLLGIDLDLSFFNNSYAPIL